MFSSKRLLCGLNPPVVSGMLLACVFFCSFNQTVEARVDFGDTFFSLGLWAAVGFGGAMFAKKIVSYFDENKKISEVDSDSICKAFASLVYPDKKLSDFVARESVLEEAKEFIRSIDGFNPLCQSGCAKTLLIRGSALSGKKFLAHAIACELGCAIIEVPGRFFVEHSPFFLRVAERLSRKRPTMLFVDHIESFASCVVARESDLRRNRLIEMFSENIKRVKASDNILLVASIDSMSRLHTRLKDSFSFDKTIHIPLLGVDERCRVLVDCLPTVSEEDTSRLAEETSGFTVPLLHELINQAKVRGENFDLVCRRLKQERLGSLSSVDGELFSYTLSEKTKFDDVIGHDESLIEIKDVFDFLQNRERYLSLGARMIRGLLLYGPTGCGKTLIARALAGETGCCLISVSGAHFVKKCVGTGPMSVRALFRFARSMAKESTVIIFIDEIDGLVNRDHDGCSSAQIEYDNTTNELLSQMDGILPNDNIVVIGATNLIGKLDSALLRPGRFDRKVEISLPDQEARQNLIAYFLKRLLLDRSCDATVVSKRFALQTDGYSGAELENFLNEAAMLAARNGDLSVDISHFEGALRKTSTLSHCFV